MRIRDPGWKKFGSGTRDEHPGFAQHLIAVYLRFELGGDSGVEVAAGACCC
jgi:hypothetical protein